MQLRRPQLTAGIPWSSALTLLQLTRFHIASGDAAGARTILRDLNDLLRDRPDLGNVGDAAKRLAEQARALPMNIAGATTLTPAELRLLPLLPTHLSFPEIADRLCLSRHTIRRRRSRSTASSTCHRAAKPSPAPARLACSTRSSEAHRPPRKARCSERGVTRRRDFIPSGRCARTPSTFYLPQAWRITSRRYGG